MDPGLRVRDLEWGRRGSRNFSKGGGGGLGRKILKEKFLLIHVSTRVHIKTRHIRATLSLFFLLKRIVFYFFALFYYSHIYF